MTLGTQPPFVFDQQQRNTLKVSDLAAYVQQSARDRIGWIHVRQVWLPDWQPEKWAYEVQRIEVTFQSYETWKRREAEQSVEPWEVLMLTQYSVFVTDHLPTVEAFFSRFVEKPEYVRHPDRVDCPHEYADEELSDELPARWSLVRRAWVSYLLYLQVQEATVYWDAPAERLQGQITEVGFNSFVLTTDQGAQHLWFSDRFGTHIYSIEEDGYVGNLWREPSARVALHAEDLPVWDDVLACWISLSETDSGDG
ncbi:hypothetical protein [Deinococcus humi]|uniref:Uncharacterized protein n=1 Tax=Deinococcus humi TaxID=662880 RepID=A0A7W8NDW8_9DEIO|nr:hypothetical protein [Deinococcus humi]MBB5363674.1 hypothetical protein [Deinococcus humi]GGO29825.1 hypothetical protein GCM10008949_23840 [Deinococcus humi]